MSGWWTSPGSSAVQPKSTANKFPILALWTAKPFLWKSRGSCFEFCRKYSATVDLHFIVCLSPFISGSSTAQVLLLVQNDPLPHFLVIASQTARQQQGWIRIQRDSWNGRRGIVVRWNVDWRPVSHFPFDSISERILRNVVWVPHFLFLRQWDRSVEGNVATHVHNWKDSHA